MQDLSTTINTDPKKASILIVDDEVANIKLLEKILSLKGYSEIICTQDPTEVLTLFKKYNSDLILLDLDMPQLDGFGVMDQLSAVDEDDLPSILVLTAQHMQSFCQRALDSGARDYVTKPFDVDELLSRVRNLLDVQMMHKFMHHQNDILEQRVIERTQAINETRLQVVRHLGRAAEYRDNETGLHIIRMSKIAVEIAETAGMKPQQCELLLNAAPMHDIGKIGIPDQILLKPGKLDPREWEIMQTHVQIGTDILSGDDSDLMRMARDIAYSHHEKWDGTGYPNKFKEDSIPFVGRVTALADVFDALTSERPYKKAWPVNKAIDLIKAESGKHFEPKLVTSFLQKLPEIIKISKDFAEPSSGESQIVISSKK